MDSRRIACVLLVIGAICAAVFALPVRADGPEGDKKEKPAASEKEGDHKKDGDHDKGDGHHDEFGSAGVNKDPSSPRTDLAVYSLVVFLLLFGSLSAFGWKPIVGGLEKREHNLHAELEAAKQNREESQRMLAAHQAKLDQVQDEVREIFASARKESDKLKEEILATANKEADAARKRAVTDIEQARDAALSELFDKMSQAVTNATRQIVGRAVTVDDQDRLIRESLSDLTRNLN